MRQPKFGFSCKPFPTTWISILLVALLFPCGISLPAWWGRENGPLENMQVIILSACLLLSWLAACYNLTDQKARNLWLWLTPFWLVLIGRELNWGRVFYPISTEIHGPVFISIQQLWYGPLVKPLVAIALLAMVTGIVRNDPLAYIRRTTLPLCDIIILFIATVLAFVFDKNILPVLSPYGQVLEEWAELTAYFAMLSNVIITGCSQKQTSPLIPMKKYRYSTAASRYPLSKYLS